MQLTINTSRLYHLLDLYGLDIDFFLEHISEGRKNLIKKDEVFTQRIKLSILKKIDKLFNRGLAYYVDESPVKKSQKESIFFRKNQFNADLNVEAKRTVDKFERRKNQLLALSNLSDYPLDRVLPKYTLKDSPELAAKQIRKSLNIKFNTDKRTYLSNIINALAAKNILVFEFVEASNKKHKANIDGFYISPNIIVLKRQQKAFRREIFTLAHEIGHYIIDIEEIDTISFSLDLNDESQTEKWCNEFAFYFLADYNSLYLNSLDVATQNNDYHIDLVKEMSERTHLSKLAIFTQLLILNKISNNNYRKIKHDFKAQFEARESELRARRLQEKLENPDKKQQGSIPKPIISDLQKNIVRSAYYEGIVNDAQFCSYLNIKPETIEKYLY